MRLVLEPEGGGLHRSDVDPVLTRAIVRGRLWFDRLVQGQAQSISEIAEAEGVTRHYVSRLIPLAFLAPDIVETIFSGTQPVHLTAEKLTKHAELPLDWAQQRALLECKQQPGAP